MDEKVGGRGVDFSPNSCNTLLSGDDMVLEKRHDANALRMMRGDGQRAGCVHS